MRIREFVWVLGGLLFGMSASADDYAKNAGASGPRYTFSWPLENSSLKPRGGTSEGPAVTLDRSPSVAWQALRESDISEFERDRRAILAMAGTYRVTFDFLEIVPYTPPQEPSAPYQSWATEKIYVDRDDGDSISLVHILEIRVVQDDGSVSEPIVTKHWRQDWQYEPAHIVEYHGGDRWERRKLSVLRRKGAWAQTVYQVDESPRYASVGRWEHSPNFSTWLSRDTWRPLPRREWSVREDYHALIGTNRYTVFSTGWIQEENNLKAVLTEQRALHASEPFRAREYGVARYERIRDADFAAADAYYEQTKIFWDQVHDRWSAIFDSEGSVTLRGPVDKLGLFRPLFAHADAIREQGGLAAAKNEEVIEAALRDMGAL